MTSVLLEQTGWGKKRGELELLNAASQNIMLQLKGEKDGRRDLWAESKVNNYNMVTHFFGARLKEDHLSHLICNFPVVS